MGAGNSEHETARSASGASHTVGGSLHRDERGATTLEWVLLAGAIALPSYYIMQGALNMLVAHFRMMGVMSGLPVP